MSRIKVTPDINPALVLYNVVMSNTSDYKGKIEAKPLMLFLQDLGVEMSEEEVSAFLSKWYKRGLLTTSGTEICVA